MVHYTNAYTHFGFIRVRQSMRTTLKIDDDLLHRGQAPANVQEKTTLVRDGLKALIARESARRLARLGGSMPQLEPIPRRQSDSQA